MRRREFIGLIGVAALPCAARSQVPAIPSVGFLESGSLLGRETFLAAFRQGLGDAGFIEGRNVTVEYRWANNEYDRLPSLAADLVRKPVSVIFAGNVVSAVAAKAATSAIPVVFITGVDPVQVGLVRSISRPHENLTGISMFGAGLAPKRLELLHELIPTARTVALLLNPQNANAEVQKKEVEAAAQALGLTVHVLNATSERDFEPTYRKLAEIAVDALVIGADPIFNNHRDRLAALAARYTMPAIYEWREFTIAGGLISYGTSLTGSIREAGIYVGRILSGEKPGDLPVAQPTKFELVVNLKTARQLALEIPPTLLARADEVIE